MKFHLFLLYGVLAAATTARHPSHPIAVTLYALCGWGTLTMAIECFELAPTLRQSPDLRFASRVAGVAFALVGFALSAILCALLFTSKF